MCIRDSSRTHPGSAPWGTLHHIETWLRTRARRGAQQRDMGSERPPDDARFEGLGDWLVSHGQDALARGTGRGDGRKGPARWSIRRMVRMAVRVLIPVALAWLVLSALSGPLANYLWFQNVGFGGVWAVQFTYTLALFLAGQDKVDQQDDRAANEACEE